MIEPTRITFAKRCGVILLRVVMSLFKFSIRFRAMPPAPGSVTNHRYGKLRDETLQFIPRKPGTAERAPVIYIHGGGWIAGKKELYTGDLFFLADQGHPVFNIEYPLAPEHPHPAILRSLLS